MGDPLTAFLSSENVPRVTPYFGSNVEKPTITRDDRHVVDDNAFDIPEIAAALRNLIAQQITGHDHTFLFSRDLFPMSTYHGKQFQWLMYETRAPAVPQYAMEGAIPMVQQSVRKYNAKTERYAVCAKFNIPEELHGEPMENQGLLVYKLVTDQLAAVAVETICDHNMRFLMSVSNALKEEMAKLNMFENWTVRDYVDNIKLTYGMANRGDGSFLLGLQKVESQRIDVNLVPHTDLIIHPTTKQLLKLDRTDYFIGGAAGPKRLESDPEKMDRYGDYDLHTVRSFLREGASQPVNHLEQYSFSAEFYPFWNTAGKPLTNIAIYNQATDNWEIITAKDARRYSLGTVGNQQSRPESSEIEESQGGGGGKAAAGQEKPSEEKTDEESSGDLVVVVRDMICYRMAASVTHKKDAGRTLMGGFESIGSTDGSNFSYLIHQTFEFGTVVYTAKNVHVLWDTTYLHYEYGKSNTWCTADMYKEWVRESCQHEAGRRRGDMWAFTVNAAFFDDFITPNGRFDSKVTNGHVLRDADSGVRINFTDPDVKTAFATMETKMRNRAVYFVRAQPSLLFCRGTTRSVGDDNTPGDVIYTGKTSLDGGDYIGARDVRNARSVKVKPLSIATAGM